MTKVMVLISTMLLSSCKDNQIKDNNQKTSIENTKDQIISYKPNTQELGICSTYMMSLVANSDGTYSISTSDIHPNDINITTLQNYCHDNDINDIIINEGNKIEIVKAIVGMQRKNRLSEEGKEEIGLYVFNTINKSDTKNILSACFDNEYNNMQTEIITDNIQNKYINPKHSPSLEDQYLVAEEKQNDTTLSQEERKKQAKIYNSLSTELLMSDRR